MLNRLEVDRAVFFMLASRVWQFLAGPVTILLIVSRFSRETQGYYYTFGSLAALQTFVELGLHAVVLNLASHEWSRLAWSPTERSIHGDAAAHARLCSLARGALRWYFAAGAAFVMLVGFAGAWFLAQKDAAADWYWPWWGMIAATGGSVCLMSFIAILEGCQQNIVVGQYRLAQAMSSNFAVWACIVSGWGLWALAAAAWVRLASELALIGVRYRAFFAAIFQGDSGDGMNWRRDVWPLQLRMALQSLFAWFAGSLFNVIIFQYQGPAAAGLFGMTWNIVMTMQLAALAWLQARAPLFGALVARQDYRELDRVWYRVTRVSWAILATGGGLFLVVLALINSVEVDRASLAGPVARFLHLIAQRMLPPLAAAPFVAAAVLWHIPQSQAVYVKSHLIDPFTRLNAIGNSTIAVLAWWLGSRFGAAGAGWGYMAVVVLIFLPGYSVLWRRCRSDFAPAARSSNS